MREQSIASLYKNVKSDLYARYKAKSVSARVVSRVKDMPFPFIATTISLDAIGSVRAILRRDTRKVIECQ